MPSPAHGRTEPAPSLIDRRFFLLGAAGALAAGCTGTRHPDSPYPPAAAYAPARSNPEAPPHDPQIAAHYGPIHTERFPIPGIDTRRVEPRFLRQEVDYATSESPGSIVVDPDQRFLYLVRENGRALRYGVGVGREGFGWSGRAEVGRKAEWPTWTPPASMIEREPQLAEYAGGMEPGLDNPLGARALYLYENGRDTLYRLHGTNEPWSIGRAMSSGCVRLFNQDIIDLYDRTPRGTTVVVRPHSGPVA